MSCRPPSKPTTGLYKRIYFDLTIFDKCWEGSYCVIYYVNEYTKQH